MTSMVLTPDSGDHLPSRPHHPHVASFRHSAEAGCRVCSTVWMCWKSIAQGLPLGVNAQMGSTTYATVCGDAVLSISLEREPKLDTPEEFWFVMVDGERSSPDSLIGIRADFM